MRTDKFKVGDKVSIIDADDYADDAVQQSHWRKYGRGPFVIEEIEDVPEFMLKPDGLSTLHTQFVYVNGERFSGYWFKPAA